MKEEKSESEAGCKRRISKSRRKPSWRATQMRRGKEGSSEGTAIKNEGTTPFPTPVTGCIQ